MERREDSVSERGVSSNGAGYELGNGVDSRRDRAGQSVGLFIDFEYLDRCAKASRGRHLDAGALGSRLYDLASARGNVRMSRAYGDWTSHGGAARNLRRSRVEPVLALPRESGASRVGMELALDVHSTLFQDPPIDVYVVVSGDAELHPLLTRVREAGHDVFVASMRDAAGRELGQGAAGVTWLDDILEVQEREEEPVDVENYDWGPFVQLLSVLEGNLEFIGLNYLIRRVLDRGNCGYSDLRRKQEIINAAQSMGIIEVYQVDNKEEAGDPVSACRLVPDHPVVTRCAEAEAGAE